MDWGLFILSPDANGKYAGEFTGTFPSYGGIDLTQDVTTIYREGYPSEHLWLTAARFFGNGNYLCTETFQRIVRSVSGHLYLGFYNRCPMNGGSSGGPNFVRFANGTYGIVAVNNRAFRNIETGDADSANNIWFDQDYVTFVRSVRALLGG